MFVRLSSEEYGKEDFDQFDTDEEVIQAYGRLVKESQRAFRKDRIARSIALVVAETIIE